MPTSYSTLLGLALPVTGELSGTWGDEVNNYITQYLDSAVAGVQTISGSQTAVTLSRTTNAALSQAGSGSTGSSQYQIINCTGNPASALTITVPSTSKVYVVLNNTSTSQTVTVKPSAAAGVTVAAARAALIAWNGTDFELVATDDASKMNGVLAAVNGGTGQSSYAVGDILYASTTTALSKLADVATGNALISGGVGVAPSYGKIGLTTHVSGTLPVANGGTGLTSGTSGGVLGFTATGTIASSAALAANAIVIGGGAGATPTTTTTGTGVVTAIGNAVNTTGGLVTQSGTLAASSLLLGGGASTAISSTTTGTGVVTALGTAVGSAGAFVVNGGALGTPSSGTVTNLTGTASININGTVGATTPNTGAFTSVTSTSASGILTRAAASQDGVELIGRAGGTLSYKVSITPTTLTASRTLTAPDVTGTIITTGDTSTVTNTMLAGSIANAKLANSTISGVALGSNLATLTLNTSGTGLSGSTTYNGSGAATFTVASNATNANTASTIVARDASGNFSAGTITATLSGNATNVSGTVAVANGGTGATSAPTARTNLGATTLGSNLFTITNPSAVTFPRFNADNTVSALDAATFRSAIGAGTGGGSVTSVSGTGTVNGITLTGTVTSSGSLTLGGTLSGVSLSTQVTGTLPVGNGGTGATTLTGVLKGNGTSAFTAGTVSLTSEVAGTLPVGNGGTGATTLTANNFLLGNGTSAVTASSLLQVSGSYVRPVAYADTVVAAGNTGTALTLTCTQGNVFTATLTGNATITLSSPIATGSTSITLILTNDATAGRTVAWAGGSFIFPGGAASLSRTTTANAVDVWVFFTPNGGTTWYGNIAMKDMKA